MQGWSTTRLPDKLLTLLVSSLRSDDVKFLEAYPFADTKSLAHLL
jgi:hypothetical protein